MTQRTAYIRLSVVLVAAALFALACAGDREPAASVVNDRTHQLYRRNCAICHGADGAGKQLGSQIIPSLREGQAADGTDERLRTQIARGGNGMPPFDRQLSDREIDDLVRLIRQEFQNKKPR